MPARPFRSVLIANRGEIAVRVIQACQELGLRAIAVYSDADRAALHVQRADAAYRIGPPPAAESYLNVPALLEAARVSGAEAVHPGYGFLAENADFAQACLDAGLVFVGPPPGAIRAMGNKSAAKRLMEQAGVPVVPGYQGEAQDDATFEREAARIGFPLLVKAAAGGGGRGMRVVPGLAALPEALESARREALAAFGDPMLLLERYVSPARHVEVQVFADQQGQTVHLGERECSIQRRHQKVVEEAPSPAVSPELRQAMGQAAVRAALAVGYVSAGTVEFVLDEQGQYYFLEMNTRIQVEHPVTELVTGLDLVQLQLRVAAGEPLPFRQEDVHWDGHAIECRIVAEDPRRGFAPQTGTLAVFEPPRGVGIRNDVGTYAGDTIGMYYDSLLAKLIVHGRDRAQAISRLRWALEHYRVGGVGTNLELLRFIVDHPEFRAGRTFTNFIPEFWRPESSSGAPPLEALLAAVASDLLASGIASGVGPRGMSDDVWRAAGAWRIARGGMPFRFRAGDRLLSATVERDEQVNGWQIEVEGETVTITADPLGDHGVLLRRGEETLSAQVVRDGERLLVQLDGRAYTLTREPASNVEAAEASGSGESAHGQIAAPMPAKVVKVLVRPGERVKPHQTLVVLESMKIEHLVEAPYAAVVERVRCRAGEVVPEGAVLVDLEAQ